MKNLIRVFFMSCFLCVIFNSQVFASYTSYDGYVVLDPYSTYGDNKAYVSNSLGGDFKIADWYDIKDYYLTEGYSSTNPMTSIFNAPGTSATVTVGGREFWSGDRRYFATVSPPGALPHSNYLSHANVGNHNLDLGSWWGTRQVLAYSEALSKYGTTTIIGGDSTTAPSIDFSTIQESIREDFNNNRGVLKYYSSNTNSFIGVEQLFDPTKNTYVLTHGWNGVGSSLVADNLEDKKMWVYSMASEISQKENANVLVFDWTALANSTDFNPLSVIGSDLSTELLIDYVKSGGDWWVPNSQVDNMANELASQLSDLYVNSGMSTASEINLIGHSLGAGISAKAMLLLENTKDDNPLFSASLNRLTLLDAPEDTWAALSGGKVNLAPIVSLLDDNQTVAIENIYSANPGAVRGGYGVAYSGADNTQTNFPIHGEVPDWYSNTINPLDYISGNPLSSSPSSWGFDRSDEYLLQNDGIHIAGRYVDIVEVINGEEVVTDTFQDNYLSAGNDDVHSTVYRNTQIDGTSWYSYTPSGQGLVFDIDLGTVLSAGSPIYAYYDLSIPEDAIGFSFDFMPKEWDSTDMLTVSINNSLLYSLSADYFIDDWMSTGLLDISMWAGELATFTVGFLSDFTGHTLVVGEQYFTIAESAPVPEPSTFLLLGGGLAGLAFYRKKKK